MNYLKKDTTFFCVDDDDQMRADVVNCLRELGFVGDIHTAVDGQDAIDKVKNTTGEIADFIISDMVMPKKTGCEFVAELRKEAAYKEIPILMLTSITTREVIMDCIGAGANNYVVKPVEKTTLANKIVSVWHVGLES